VKFDTLESFNNFTDKNKKYVYIKTHQYNIMSDSIKKKITKD